MINSNLPRHVAIIMDGNGRWAEKRGLPRVRGHQIGVQCVEKAMDFAAKLGIKYLTFYAFSKENWQRPKDEVGFLMELLSLYLDREFEKMKKNNIVFNTIGDIQDLPAQVRTKVVNCMQATRQNTGLTATFALSYSSRYEITQACREIAREAVLKKIDPETITEDTVSEHLLTAGIPDPDLLIRTSGEMRISNFLLWQISYTELYVTEKFWPEFDDKEFMKAIEAYQKRERRFGRTRPLDTEAV